MINFQTSPKKYEHWKLAIDGAVANLTMDVQEDATQQTQTEFYDLGVDIELADAIQRIRFEHPEVKALSSPALSRGSSAPARISTCSALLRTPSK